ncbi:MAG: DUF4180 domain-containing protein [Bacteroidetes bacterium]|nr:DUF4180 domain-containing protein [Bacteroidota bacterium]
MEFIEHKKGSELIVEVTSDRVIINDEQEALEIIANIAYLYDSHLIILHADNLMGDFFDLKSGLAGGVLQKFSNYRARVAIVGDFSQYSSKSLKEFILESNKGRIVNFLPDVSEALETF